MEPIADQRVGVRAGDHEDRSAVTAVAAARPSTRDALLSTEREAAAASVAGGDVNVDFVNEHRIWSSVDDALEAVSPFCSVASRASG
jgi:hypothetical protein